MFISEMNILIEAVIKFSNTNQLLLNKNKNSSY